MNAKKYFADSDYYALWTKEVRTRASLAAVVSHLMKMICPQPNESLLDIGVGEGRFIIPCVTVNLNYYIGLDVSKGMLAEAKKRVIKLPIKYRSFIDLVLGDAEHLPFQHSVFDKVVCFATSFYLPSQYSLISEAKRVLKAHHVFICDFMNYSNIRVYLNQKMRVLLLLILKHLKPYTNEFLEKIAHLLIKLVRVGGYYGFNDDWLTSVFSYGVTPFFPVSFSSIISLFQVQGFKLKSIVGEKHAPLIIVSALKSDP